MVKSPDVAVRDAIMELFRRFERHGAVRQAALSMRDDNLELLRCPALTATTEATTTLRGRNDPVQSRRLSTPGGRRFARGSARGQPHTSGIRPPLPLRVSLRIQVKMAVVDARGPPSTRTSPPSTATRACLRLLVLASRQCAQGYPATDLGEGIVPVLHDTI